MIVERWGVPLLGIAAVAAVALPSCFKEDEKIVPKEERVVAEEVSGELFVVAQERGLKEPQMMAALKTYVPSGGRDTYIGLLSTGTSGRLAVFGMPSMRILKYVGLFTPEPWQGFGYDDESKDLLQRSAREDIAYSFGDSGLLALSEKGGAYDGVAAFVVDGANGRVGVVHLDDYEAKQVVTNPVFRSSHPGVAVTPDTEYVLQTTEAPELPNGAWAAPGAGLASQLRGGVTFWRFVRGEGTQNRLSGAGSFTVELPPYVQGETDAGKGVSAGWVLTLGRCRGEGVVPGLDKDCGAANTPAVLHIIDVEAARKASSSGAPVALAQGVVRQVEIPAGPTSLAISPDGTRALITHQFGAEVSVLDLQKLKGADWGGAKADAFGVPTLPGEAAGLARVSVGGPTVDASFAKGGLAYVTVAEPGTLVRLDLASGQVKASLALGFSAGRVLIPEGDTASPSGELAVVMNTRPHGRFVSVGPMSGLNPHLIEIKGEAMVPLYDMAVPQATSLAGVAVSSARIDEHAIMRYPLGTDTRSGELSAFRTTPGDERVERKGNRVHVFGTLIRSHITPEIVEVNEGDVVTFHMTNLEQAQDQTHGFTVNAHNVHGSWEPGKVASVTFTADKAGVYPYYCTEFCSALHLEMMGYLMVKPRDYVATDEDKDGVADVDPAQAKAAYEEKSKVIKETQGVIDAVVVWLKEHDFAKNKQAEALVTDAFAQLEKTKDIQPKIDEAVAKEDWAQAALWAEQYYQYQVKCADAGLRAKKILEEEGQR